VAHTLITALSLGSSNTGLTDLRAQLLDETGTNVGSAVSTGFVEIGSGFYSWYYTAFPNGFRGSVKVYSLADSAEILSLVAINPEEAENSNTSGVLVRTTVASVVTADSEFTLAAGSADNDAYNGCVVVIQDQTTALQKSVGWVTDYVGSTRQITLLLSSSFALAIGDLVTILADQSLKPNSPERQLNLDAGTASANLIKWKNFTPDDLVSGLVPVIVQSMADEVITNAAFATNSVVFLWGTRGLTMIELDGSVYRYTANALELAPSSSISVSDILSATVPASYAIGTVGYNIGRLSTGRVTVSSIIAASGEVSIVQGDDYFAADGRSLDFVGESANQWPDLEDADVYLHVSDGTLTVVGSVVTPTGTQRVRFEPDSTDTSTLPEGDYDFTISALLSNGHRATLVRDILHVRDTEAG
jgi:hypothetical protein